MQHNSPRTDLPRGPCQNCRKRRRTCDRSLPNCIKCASTGQICRGYGNPLRWTNSVASRGKLSGKTFDVLANDSPRHAPTTPSSSSTRASGIFIDESDLHLETVSNSQRSSTTAEFYLAYYDNQVCKDLVLKDLPGGNSFRQLLNLVHEHEMLREIIIAISALHYSNASRLNIAEDRRPPNMARQPYQDALAAKSRALSLLAEGLSVNADTNLTAKNDTRKDATLACIMLFIMFEMLDSGTSEWRFHTQGAKQLMAYLRDNARTATADVEDLRTSLMANCIVYDTLGATLTITAADGNDAPDPLPITDEDLANTCLSFPPPLLRIIRDVSYSLRVTSSKRLSAHNTERLQSLTDVFDVHAWVSSLQRVSASFELEKRMHIGIAYKNAVKIYVSRAGANAPEPLEQHVSEVVHHLSFIPPEDWFFKATCWPSFIAGAETNNLVMRRYILERFQEGIKSLPWGYLADAVDLLQQVWSQRDNENSSMDWVIELKESQTEVLIA